MGRDAHELGQIRLQRAASVPADADLGAEQRLGRGGSEADESAWFHHRKLGS
jgi:hypothetical protein